MKIKIEYPYTQNWTSASLVVNLEGRNTVILYSNITKSQSSTAYARYLMAVKEKRYLTENEQVDHIDTNHTNDSLENLQILTVEQHKLKTKLEQSGLSYKSFICANCSVNFNREIRQCKKETKFCSLNCSHQGMSSILKHKNINRAKQKTSHNYTIEDITKHIWLGLSDSDIAKLYGVNRNTILNFRKSNDIISSKNKINEIVRNNLDLIIKLHKDGISNNKIAKQLGINSKVITRFLKKINI